MNIIIQKYGRHWAVLVDGELLCLTVYLKGAKAVRDRIKELYYSAIKPPPVVQAA